jgi:signal peptidase
MIRLLQTTLLVITLLTLAAVGSAALLPRLFGWSTLVVLSGSMEPAMPVGGLAFVEPVSPGDVREGDVVTYPRPDRTNTLVSHRVISVSDQLGGPTIWTRGDANPTPDPWAITDDAVVGRVRFTVPFLGSLTQDARHPTAFLVMVAVPGIILILTEVLRIITNLRALRRNDDQTPNAETLRLLAQRDQQ